MIQKLQGRDLPHTDSKRTEHVDFHSNLSSLTASDDGFENGDKSFVNNTPLLFKMNIKDVT